MEPQSFFEKLKSKFSSVEWRKILGRASWVLTITLAPITFIVIISQNALPGGALYPVKRGIENIIITAAAVSPATRAAFRTDLTERRLDEAEKLLLTFENTRGLGEFVSEVYAAEVDIQSVKDEEKKQELSQKMGASLEEYIQRLKLVKKQIIAKRESNLPLQLEQPLPTPQPTNTPVPVPTARPGEPPIPTNTPVPLATLTPTPTPLPTNTPIPVATSRPGQPPVPTNTSVPLAPTSTPTPTRIPTILPSATPTRISPTPTPTRIPTPSPTPTPSPEDDLIGQLDLATQYTQCFIDHRNSRNAVEECGSPPEGLTREALIDAGVDQGIIDVIFPNNNNRNNRNNSGNNSNNNSNNRGGGGFGLFSEDDDTSLFATEEASPIPTNTPSPTPTPTPTTAPTRFGPCYGKADGTCTLDTRLISTINGLRLDSITAYGKYWNFDVNSSSLTDPFNSNGSDLTSVARFAQGPCKDKAVGTCKFDTRTFINIGGKDIESITAYGKYWNFEASGADPFPGGNGSDLTTVARYTAGPCQGKSSGTCSFDTRTMWKVGNDTYESITAYGRLWNYKNNEQIAGQFGVDLADSNNPEIQRYISSGMPCVGKNPCVIDTRHIWYDSSGQHEALTAYGQYWNYLSNQFIDKGTLSSGKYAYAY